MISESRRMNDDDLQGGNLRKEGGARTQRAKPKAKTTPHLPPALVAAVPTPAGQRLPASAAPTTGRCTAPALGCDSPRTRTTSTNTRQVPPHHPTLTPSPWQSQRPSRPPLEPAQPFNNGEEPNCPKRHRAPTFPSTALDQRDANEMNSTRVGTWQPESTAGSDFYAHTILHHHQVVAWPYRVKPWAGEDGGVHSVDI